MTTNFLTPEISAKLKVREWETEAGTLLNLSDKQRIIEFVARIFAIEDLNNLNPHLDSESAVEQGELSNKKNEEIFTLEEKQLLFDLSEKYPDIAINLFMFFGNIKP